MGPPGPHHGRAHGCWRGAVERWQRARVGVQALVGTVTVTNGAQRVGAQSVAETAAVAAGAPCVAIGAPAPLTVGNDAVCGRAGITILPAERRARVGKRLLRKARQLPRGARPPWGSGPPTRLLIV